MKKKKKKKKKIKKDKKNKEKKKKSKKEAKEEEEDPGKCTCNREIDEECCHFVFLQMSNRKF